MSHPSKVMERIPSFKAILGNIYNTRINDPGTSIFL